jgi:SAM-dependent methyltransferase
MPNTDQPTEKAFDDKWGAPWIPSRDAAHSLRMFHASFGMFPFAELREAEGFDLGCGLGRHAVMVGPMVGKLHCIDPSPNGIASAKRRMHASGNVVYHLAGVDDMPLADGSQDFGYSMGVLHHIPDPQDGLNKCVAKLKPGAPFLLYLYYSFDNRPWWFRMLWRLSDVLRRAIVRLPFRWKKRTTDAIAILVYFPLSRFSLLMERMGVGVANFPLSFYRRVPLLNLKVSSLDRFGTNLELRFSRAEMEEMMKNAGLEHIRFQEHPPYWIALGRASAVGARASADRG